MWHAKEPPRSKRAALYRHWSVADLGISEPGGPVGFLGSGDCVDVSSYIPFVFVMRVKNKLDIVNILVDYIESICVLCSQNLQQKRNPKKNSDKRGQAVLDPPLTISFLLVRKQFYREPKNNIKTNKIIYMST